jgi:hypothetical protein
LADGVRGLNVLLVDVGDEWRFFMEARYSPVGIVTNSFMNVSAKRTMTERCDVQTLYVNDLDGKQV